MVYCVQWSWWFVSRKELSARGRLDLAHGRSLSDATGTTAHVNARVAALETREDSRDDEGSEAKPEESSGSLSLVAALGGVGRAVGDGVAVGVRLLTC
jgi:hypothetical protein